ncbi:unnamed protein product [Orchesella dallaii]|uniref:Uncharacterized protein n=1 Tax=Orchesella dallaii TaxID=48710 RepID=A0ABP1RU64_9HEXA
MSAYVSKKSTLKSFSEWKDPTPYGPNLECDYLKDDWCQREADCTDVFLGSFMSAYFSKKSTLKSLRECRDPTPDGRKLGMRLSQRRFVPEGRGLHRRVPRVIYECVCFKKVNIEVIQRVQESDPRWTKVGMQLSQRRFVLEG